MAATKSVENLLPVYIPWRSFTNYIASLKNTTVPDTLDGSVKPSTMSGGLWRQLLVALRFLGLIGNENKVSDGLEALASANGTEQWANALKEHLLPAYDRIVGDLPIEKATTAQLQKKFVEVADVKDQMLKKCVRFYLHALKESGTTYSSHLSMRDESTSGSPRKRTPRAPHTHHANGSNETPNNSAAPQGMIDFPIPLGSVSGFIRVPAGITLDQFPMVEAMVRAVETLAKQNSPGDERKPTR